MEQVETELIKLGVIIITGLLGLLSIYATLFFEKLGAKVKTETSSIKNEDARKLLNDTIDRTQMLVNKNIISANETIVKEIKSKTEDGILSLEDGKTILLKVKSNILATLSDSSKEILSATSGDIDKFIETEIEHQLAIIKGKI